MIAPKDRAAKLTESAAELEEVAQRGRRVADDLSWLYERTSGFSKPAWETGWVQPLAGLLPEAQRFREWAAKLEALAASARQPER